ncbi:hypothetical protein [uncultured Phycicoccus sp.]|uniref:hypothetical protein n=1 Tax=uncultured Phycicoccus sp. TaxID=661422 RepID=UPI002632B348|nr:hypothetical protein [uncultured Phycicoccus sp.]
MSSEALESNAQDLMQELLDLEAAGCGIHSAAVSLDLDREMIEIEVATEDEDENVALARVNSCIRAAIHATGGNTPGWEEAPHQVAPERLDHTPA